MLQNVVRIAGEEDDQYRCGRDQPLPDVDVRQILGHINLNAVDDREHQKHGPTCPEKSSAHESLLAAHVVFAIVVPRGARAQKALTHVTPRRDSGHCCGVVGTNYDVDDLLAAARGSRDWIGRYGGWLLALLLLACLLTAIDLVTLFTTRPRMRTQRTE